MTQALNYLRSAIDVKASVCCRVISMQELPISKNMKEKPAKVDIGCLQLTNVFSKDGSKGLLALLSMPAEGLITKNSKAPPGVTKNRKVVGK